MPAKRRARRDSMKRVRAYSSRVPSKCGAIQRRSRGAPSVRWTTWTSSSDASVAPAPIVSSSGCAATTSTLIARLLKQRDGLAVAVQRPDVDVRRPRPHRPRPPAPRDPRIHQRAHVDVAAPALAPQLVQRPPRGAAHLERAPDPVRVGAGLLHLDLEHVVVAVHHHRVEELRPLDREADYRESYVAGYGVESSVGA